MKKVFIALCTFISVAVYSIEPRVVNNALDLPDGLSFDYKKGGEKLNLSYSNYGWDEIGKNGTFHISRNKEYIEEQKSKNSLRRKKNPGIKLPTNYTPYESVRVLKSKSDKTQSIISNNGEILTILEIRNGSLKSSTKCQKTFADIAMKITKFGKCVTVTKLFCNKIKSTFPNNPERMFGELLNDVIECKNKISKMSKEIDSSLFGDSDALNDSQEAAKRNSKVIDNFDDIVIVGHRNSFIAKNLDKLEDSFSKSSYLLSAIDQCKYIKQGYKDISKGGVISPLKGKNK